MRDMSPPLQQLSSRRKSFLMCVQLSTTLTTFLPIDHQLICRATGAAAQWEGWDWVERGIFRRMSTTTGRRVKRHFRRRSTTSNASFPLLSSPSVDLCNKEGSTWKRFFVSFSVVLYFGLIRLSEMWCKLPKDNCGCKTSHKH